jgi:hypothetical protein
MIKTKIAVIISIAIIWASMNFVTAIPKMHAGGLMSLAVFSSQDIDEFNSDLTKVCSDETKLNSDADEYQ